MIHFFRQTKGFTLIELIIFIVISGFLIAAIMLAANNALIKAPSISNQVAANMLAQQCMEWLIGNRRSNGYTIYPCPSVPTASLCNSVSGYTIAASVTCTTVNGNSNFKTLAVTVSGNGNAMLQTLIAAY